MTLPPSRRRIPDLLAALLVVAYVVFASTLAILQHDSFHTHAFDTAYFDNVIWNTSQGRLFQNDLPDKPANFLGDHFSPALLAIAPLYWLWSDPRMLLIAQAVALALGVLPAYLLVRPSYPWLALAVLAALYLNPAMLGIALSEFHEIALAVPLLAWAVYAIVRGKLGKSFVAAILGALLVKEEVAAMVAGIGLYLFVISIRKQRSALSLDSQPSEAQGASHLPIRSSSVESSAYVRSLGLALVALSFVWLAFAWGVLPAYLPGSVSHWLERYGDIAPTPAQGVAHLLSDPLFLLTRFASTAKWLAVLRVLWPLALLPVLAPSVFALSLPVFAYLMVSNKTSVSQFQFWYVAPLLPALFIAVGATIGHARPVVARLFAGALLLASLAAYYFLGAGPLAANYEPARFAITDRTQCAYRILQRIPTTAELSAQDNLLPHLDHRPTVHVFPSLGDPPDLYVVMDTRLDVSGGYSNWPAIRPLDVPAEVNRFLARPTYNLVDDECDYKLLKYVGDDHDWKPLEADFGQQIQMLGYEIALSGVDGDYGSPTRPIRAGDPLRVTLWWQAEGKPKADYTVFVHALDAAGQLAGQNDSPPAGGFRPTSGWAAGELVKDIHYFTADRDVLEFAIGLYDARSGDRLKTSGGANTVTFRNTVP